jgi:hypothetical protein
MLPINRIYTPDELRAASRLRPADERFSFSPVRTAGAARRLGVTAALLLRLRRPGRLRGATRPRTA